MKYVTVRHLGTTTHGNFSFAVHAQEQACPTSMEGGEA